MFADNSNKQLLLQVPPSKLNSEASKHLGQSSPLVKLKILYSTYEWVRGGHATL